MDADYFLTISLIFYSTKQDIKELTSLHWTFWLFVSREEKKLFFLLLFNIIETKEENMHKQTNLKVLQQPTNHKIILLCIYSLGNVVYYFSYFKNLANLKLQN